MTRAARWLNFVLWLFILTIVALTIPLPFSEMEPGARSQFLIFQPAAGLICVGALVLVRLGHTRAVSYFVLTLVYIATVYSHAIVFQTIHEPSVAGYFALIPLAGLLFDRRTMIWVVVLSVLTISITYYFEVIGLLAPRLGVRATIDDLMLILVCLGLNTSLMLAILANTEESAEQARRCRRRPGSHQPGVAGQSTPAPTGAGSVGGTRGSAHKRAGRSQRAAGSAGRPATAQRDALPQPGGKLARLHLHLEHGRQFLVVHQSPHVLGPLRSKDSGTRLPGHTCSPG